MRSPVHHTFLPSLLSLLVLVVPALAPGCGNGGGGGSPVTNLRISGTSFDLQNGVVVFTKDEVQENADFNGDFDRLDLSHLSHDLRTGETRRLEVTGAYQRSGSLVTIDVLETDQGDLDRNGDGDLDDTILFIHDLRTGETIDTGLVALGTVVTPELAVFSVLEEGQDLNLDGDTDDLVALVFDPLQGRVLPTGLAVSPGDNFLAASATGRKAVIAVNENAQGSDLDGNSRIFGSVVHVFDADSADTANLLLRQAGILQSVPGGVLFTVPETISRRPREGEDRNGDGDVLDDAVLHLYEPDRGVLNLELALGSIVPVATPDVVSAAVSEAAQGGADLNRDGDVEDLVAHVFDRRTGQVTNLGLALGEYPRFSAVTASGTLIALSVSEEAQGGSDLNGDGDTGDVVTHLLDARTGVTVNLGLAGAHSAASEVVALLVDESQQGTDLDGNGTTDGRVVHVLDPATGRITNLGLNGTPSAKGHLVVFAVDESIGGEDLNTDGDLDDFVAHAYSARTRVTSNLRLAVTSALQDIQTDGEVVVILADELTQGFFDLNADGDVVDRVLHVARGL
jgi:hypothetical protein